MSIEQIMEQADKQLDYGSYKKAKALYEKALNELPSPQAEQELFLEIQAAIGDCLIWMNKVGEAQKLFTKLLTYPGADDNAYLHLRLGQIAFDKDHMETAKKELRRALELGGEEIFEDEYEEYLECATE